MIDGIYYKLFILEWNYILLSFMIRSTNAVWVCLIDTSILSHNWWAFNADYSDDADFEIG